MHGSIHVLPYMHTYTWFGYSTWCGRVVFPVQKFDGLLNFSLRYIHTYIYVANAKVIYKVVTLFVSLT